MDITEDSNTNSKNKLTMGGGVGGHHEETLISAEKERAANANLDQNITNHTPSGPAYSLFYHSGN